MATPTENADTLYAFWKANQNADVSNRVPAIYEAMRAMNELVDQAANNPTVRANVFAKRGIFTAACFEYNGWVNSVITGARASDFSSEVARAALAKGDRELRAPRVIMFDGIYNAGIGGLFSPKDPSGVTSWIFSEWLSALALFGVLTDDSDPAARASGLKIIRDLAVPAKWISLYKSENVGGRLEEQLKGADWDVGTRRTLNALSASVMGRVDGELAKLAMGSLNAPSFPTADGVATPTIPGPPKPWYRNGPMLAAGLGGLLGGAMFRSRRA